MAHRDYISALEEATTKGEANLLSKQIRLKFAKTASKVQLEKMEQIALCRDKVKLEEMQREIYLGCLPGRNFALVYSVKNVGRI